MESEKLKSCPFCGGEASLTIPSEHVQADCADIYVSCDECEAEGQHFVVEMRDRTSDLWPYEQREAIAAWNTRAPADCKLADNDGKNCVLLEDHEGSCLSYDPKEVGVRLMSALGHVENCRAHGRVTDAGFAAIRSALLIADRELSRLRAPADLRSALEAETIKKLRDAAALVARAIGVTQMPDGAASALVFSGNDPGPQLEDILSARAAIASLEGHVS